MNKEKEKEIKDTIKKYLDEEKELNKLEAEISVCRSILSIIRDITNEIQTLDDLDTFICAMIQNRERKFYNHESNYE